MLLSNVNRKNRVKFGLVSSNDKPSTEAHQQSHFFNICYCLTCPTPSKPSMQKLGQVGKFLPTTNDTCQLFLDGDSLVRTAIPGEATSKFSVTHKLPWVTFLNQTAKYIEYNVIELLEKLFSKSETGLWKLSPPPLLTVKVKSYKECLWKFNLN